MNTLQKAKPWQIFVIISGTKGLNFKRKVERRENSDLVNEPGFKDANNHRVQRNPVKN